MFYTFLAPLSEQFQLFNVFNYLTFRTGGALMTAFVIAVIMGEPFIRWLKTKGTQPIRDDGPESHIVAKAGTPTMGGFIILAALIGSALLWGDLVEPVSLGRVCSSPPASAPSASSMTGAR
jgi:phospho-N-acetylmuramoyl-pentapeptide-transferase